MASENERSTDPAERASALEAMLNRATAEVAEVERAHGVTLGELTELRITSAAMHLAQQEWDEMRAEIDEEVRLCRERCEVLEERHRAMVSSTSWRTIQLGLAPYRWVRQRLD